MLRWPMQRPIAACRTTWIVGSTKAIAEGCYKTVNTVGAAVISAQINAFDGAAFPFAFGGDGAVFDLPGALAEISAKALGEVVRCAETEFGLSLRAAVIPIDEIRAAGCDVAVARYRTSPGIEYAMFGGGVRWADDLIGLSCRWTPMRSRHGKVLSLLVLPQSAGFTEAHATLVL